MKWRACTSIFCLSLCAGTLLLHVILYSHIAIDHNYIILSMGSPQLDENVEPIDSFPIRNFEIRENPNLIASLEDKLDFVVELKMVANKVPEIIESSISRPTNGFSKNSIARIEMRSNSTERPLVVSDYRTKMADSNSNSNLTRNRTLELNILNNRKYYNSFKSDWNTSVWPSAKDERKDRIINQLNIPKLINPGSKLKTILVYQGLERHTKPGQSIFLQQGCPINQCSLTDHPKHAATADLILFRDYVSPPNVLRRSSQIWVLRMLESPQNTFLFSGIYPVNWTATYRRDSTIVTPYERFSVYKNITADNYSKVPLRNYAKGKTKMVAWFVSNCFANNGRGYYVNELMQRIQVDVYGACGPMRCAKTQLIGDNSDTCDDLLRRDYRFYLAFENSNCRDYITEKLYRNAFTNNVIPVVMGAPREDYELAAPPNSFIHVDDFPTPRDLAEYLKRVAEDEQLYNSYFLWKGTGEFIDTRFWCRLCAMLHQAGLEARHSRVRDLQDWWSGESVCVSPRDQNGWASWRNTSINYERTRPGISYEYSFVDLNTDSIG